MRAREFVVENNDAINPATINLIDSLEAIRSRFQQTNQEPKIRVDSLINMIRVRPGSEMFNVDSLKNIYDKNDAVKNLISSIKDDENGTKYIYLTPAVSNIDSVDLDVEAPDSSSKSSAADPLATVGKMAKRAATRRT